MTNERLKMADTFLHSTPDLIHMISQNCGCRAPNYYARAFRKHFDISPRKYRKHHREPSNDSDTPT